MQKNIINFKNNKEEILIIFRSIFHLNTVFYLFVPPSAIKTIFFEGAQTPNFK